jgi:hypothetical protein
MLYEVKYVYHMNIINLGSWVILQKSSYPGNEHYF